MPSLLRIVAIPRDHPRAGIWETKVEFQPVDPDHPEVQPRVSYFEAKSKYGLLRMGLGLDPDGRVGWSWMETGGGGAAALVYARETGTSGLNGLWIGLLMEDRQNMGGMRPCAVGGFKRPGEKPDAASQREFLQETGARNIEVRKLPGVPLNGNRMYFEADPNDDEGMHTFSVEVPFDDLIPGLDGTMEHGFWRPKNSHMVFFPWQMAAQQSADAFAVSMIARLLAELIAA